MKKQNKGKKLTKKMQKQNLRKKGKKGKRKDLRKKGKKKMKKRYSSEEFIQFKLIFP